MLGSIYGPRIKKLDGWPYVGSYGGFGYYDYSVYFLVGYEDFVFLGSFPAAKSNVGNYSSVFAIFPFGTNSVAFLLNENFVAAYSPPTLVCYYAVFSVGALCVVLIFNYC